MSTNTGRLVDENIQGYLYFLFYCQQNKSQTLGKKGWGRETGGLVLERESMKYSGIRKGKLIGDTY